MKTIKTPIHIAKSVAIQKKKHKSKGTIRIDAFGREYIDTSKIKKQKRGFIYQVKG